jgi:two-component system CheB/CheR fusion protein
MVTSEQAALLELAPVLVRDMDSRIVLWTRGAERLYGFSKAEAIGRV